MRVRYDERGDALQAWQKNATGRTRDFEERETWKTWKNARRERTRERKTRSSDVSRSSTSPTSCVLPLSRSSAPRDLPSLTRLAFFLSGVLPPLAIFQVLLVS